MTISQKPSRKDLAQRTKEQAQRLSGYLKTQSITLSRTQSLEAIAQALHGKPWNVVRTLDGTHSSTLVAGRVDAKSGTTLVMDETSPPLTSAELMHITQAGQFALDVAVPIGVWELIEGDVDAINDTVSERITGSACGLESIEFSRHTAECVDLPDGKLLLRVVAHWAADADGDLAEEFLPVRFAWVYPDEDGDFVEASVQLSSGTVFLRAEVPEDVHASQVRVRLESLDGDEEPIPVRYDSAAGYWKVAKGALNELRDW